MDEYILTEELEALYPGLTCRKGDRVKGERTWDGEIIQGVFQGYRNVSKKEKRIVGVIYVEGDRCYDVYISPTTLQKIDK